MEFRDWIMQKFLEWEKTQPNGRSNYTKFANYLGIKVGALTPWRLGSSIPSMENIQLLATKLGSEVYSILGYADPGGTPSPTASDILLQSNIYATVEMCSRSKSYLVTHHGKW